MAREYAITIERRPFLLRPDIPPEGLTRETRPGETDGELREPLRSCAQQEGLTMRRPSKTPYTLLALEATEYAEDQGLGDQFYSNTMRAFWEEGVDLGDISVLQRLAEESGLNWQELAHHLESGRYRPTVVEHYQEAVRLGIHGIPAFLIGQQLVIGAQPYEVFKQLVDRILAQAE